MPSVLAKSKRAIKPAFETLADLVRRLGDIPLDRIHFHPPPGTATEHDLEEGNEEQTKLAELIEGTLVEKAMGYFESILAAVLIEMIGKFVRDHKLGFIAGEAAPLRYEPGLVRKPDVCFYSWSRFPKRKLPRGAFLNLAPDLAVEVLSPSNTRREMARKREECFAAGTALVWEVDPKLRTIAVYTSPAEFTTIVESGVLRGGLVLPGFKLRVKDLFKRAGELEPE